VVQFLALTFAKAKVIRVMNRFELEHNYFKHTLEQRNVPLLLCASGTTELLLIYNTASHQEWKDFNTHLRHWARLFIPPYLPYTVAAAEIFSLWVVFITNRFP